MATRPSSLLQQAAALSSPRVREDRVSSSRKVYSASRNALNCSCNAGGVRATNSNCRLTASCRAPLIWERRGMLSHCNTYFFDSSNSRRSTRRRSSTTNNAACMTDSRSSCIASGSTKEASNDGHKFIWRTTERRFIDFCLSPEEERQLRALHEKIMRSPWSCISQKEVADCLLARGESEEQKQHSLLQRLRLMGSYILSPRGLEEDGRRLFRTAIPVYEDTLLTEKCFGIGEAHFNGRIYFLLLHLWHLHCALQHAGAETLKIKLWDAFWDFLTNLLLKDGVSEFKLPAILREQQFISLGFCVALDEAFEDESSGPAGQLAHRLWVTIFEAAEEKRECPELIALTTYAMRARSFALQLPQDALIQGAFRWPEWPPAKGLKGVSKDGIRLPAEMERG